MATEKRLIDANEAIERVRYSDNYVGSSIWESGEMVEFLEGCPTVDAVEVVRCKDCKNRDEITKECKHPKAVGWDVIIPEDDDFCSYGERKDNETG